MMSTKGDDKPETIPEAPKDGVDRSAELQLSQEVWLSMKLKTMMSTKGDDKSETIPEAPKDCQDKAGDKGEEAGEEEVASAAPIPGDEKTAKAEPEAFFQPPPIPKSVPGQMRDRDADVDPLKHAIWQILTEKSPPGEQCVQEISFSEVYFKLTSKLKSPLKESLSVPLVLMAVLHIASEKNLDLHQEDDLDNFIIKSKSK